MKEKNNLKKIIIWFLISRILLVIFLLLKKDLSIFELYDSEHYIEIAEFGYTQPLLYAFFPLYPFMIKLLHYIIPSYQIAGALISNISSFLSILILSKLTKNSKFNTLCIIFTPILAYTSMVYTESLFMLLTLLGYYLYKKDKYILSAIIIGLSTLTRNSGIILWGAIGLDMLYRQFIKKDKKIKFKNILSFGLISLSICMIYPTYLYIKTGNFLEFITVQNEHWGRTSGTFIDMIINDIRIMTSEKNNPLNIIIFFENWLSFFLLLTIGIKIFKKDKVSSIYIIVSLIAFTISYRDINYWNTLSSISLFRYVLNLFPLYIYLFNDNRTNKNFTILIIFISISIFNGILIYGGRFLG